MSNTTQRIDNSLINLETLFTTVSNDLDRIDSCLPSQKATYCNEIESKLNEIDTKISKLNGDVRSLAPSQRDYYDGELESLRGQHSKLMTELRKKQTLAANDPHIKQAQQMEKNINKAQDITENLDEAIRLGNDTITTGNATMTTLLEDRRHINHIDQNLAQIHEEALTGAERAKRMVRRACFNNFLIWSIVVLLVALLGFSLYWKMRKEKKTE